MIYLAPLQGFTDFVYRNTYEKVFQSVDAFYIPYITLKGEKVLRKYEKEIIPENNLHGKSIPQILVKDEEEIYTLCSLLRDYGYSKVNLNLGCPYPMVTNRGKGSKLLSEPDKLERILEFFYNQFNLDLSVKMRAGFETPGEIEKIIQVLNRFPLKGVIIHPRIAKQLYQGEIYESAFQFAVDHLKKVPVYNGDIFSFDDFQKRSKKFPLIKDWMLGRGILMDVFLPGQIRGKLYTEEEKRELLLNFHKNMLEEYLRISDNRGNAINKMQQFWSYFSYHFERQAAVLKTIKKLKNTSFLEVGIEKIFSQEELKNHD